MSCSSAAAAGGLGRGAQLVGHHRGEMGALDGVREHVLAVRRPVLEPAQHGHEVGVERLDVGVEARLLAAFRDVRLELGLRLGCGRACRRVRNDLNAIRLPAAPCFKLATSPC